MTTRDQQRERLYRSERPLRSHSPEFTTVKECQDYVNLVTRTSWWKKWHQYNTPIEVQDGRGRRSACASHGCEISLPLWSRQKVVIFHELAHTIIQSIPEDYAAHGPEFAAVFINLVYRFLGNGMYQRLKASFKEHRVRYRLPKELISR